MLRIIVPSYAVLSLQSLLHLTRCFLYKNEKKTIEDIAIINAPRPAGPSSSKRVQWNTLNSCERRLNYFFLTGVKPQRLRGAKVHMRVREAETPNLHLLSHRGRLARLIKGIQSQASPC